jgi:hypothetical protein
MTFFFMSVGGDGVYVGESNLVNKIHAYIKLIWFCVKAVFQLDQTFHCVLKV